jgi:hypothetical protein
LSHNICRITFIVKIYDSCKALQYQFEPDFVYCTYKLRSSSVQERSVYTAFAEEKNIYFKMESLYYKRNFFRLPGYFELSIEFGVRIIVHKGTFTFEVVNYFSEQYKCLSSLLCYKNTKYVIMCLYVSSFQPRKRLAFQPSTKEWF